MKMNSVEQLKPEIMYGVECLKELRGNPVKVAQEVAVVSPHPYTKGMSKKVVSVWEGTFVIFVVLGLFILSASKASISDIENLQDQIDTLKVQVSAIAYDAASAKAFAADAAAKATAAEAAANRAAQYALDTNQKLDRLFKSSATAR